MKSHDKIESQDSEQTQERALGIDFKEIISRVIKYMVEGGAVAVAAYLIPRKKLSIQEVIMVSLTAAAVFAILDLYAPGVAIGARQGAGFGIGYSTVGTAGMVVPGIPPAV
jgi:hypothetical protein